MEFDRQKSFEYENGFYLTAGESRMARAIAHYELYKKTLGLPGDIVECGVFKGVSFMRFMMFQKLFEANRSRKIVGFDIFDLFPATDFEQDKEELKKFIDETGGGRSITKEALESYIKQKGHDNFELVKGDILKTVPEYVNARPEWRISLLNIDTDIYEPAKTIIEHLAPRVVKGGIIIFDDYGVFAGETQIADEYCARTGYKLRKFDYSRVPSYIVVE
jgi:hypothetical protein